MPLLDKKLALIAPFASGAASRPALQHVRLARKNEAISAVATDSYVAARVIRKVMPKAEAFPVLPGSLTASDLDGELLVPAPVVAASGKDIMKKSSLDVLGTAALLRTPGSENAELVSTNLTTISRRAFKIETDAYPDVDALFSMSPRKAMKVRVNAGYLKKIATMFHEFNAGNGLDPVDIEIGPNPYDPVRFSAASPTHEAEALLMPIKT